MARSRKVDHEDAINAAMAMFWKHGYCDLGTRKLEEETGITRFTLQTTYGGKMKLFLATLDAYLDQFENSDWLCSIDRSLESIARFFERRADPTQMVDVSCNGCLMLNSMTEFSAGNPQVNQRADRYARLLRKKFSEALEGAQQSGALSDGFNIAQNIEVLLASAFGLNIAIRAAADIGAGRPMAYAIATMVRGWARKIPVV